MQEAISRIKEQNVVIYDVRYSDLPSILVNKLKGNVEYCCADITQKPSRYEFNKVSVYKGLDDIRRKSGNVALLGGHAKMSCVFSYPYSSEFVCLRVELDKYTFFSLIGLIRRLIYGRKRNNSRIRYLGSMTLKSCSGRSVRWIVLQNANANIPTHYSISREIGVRGLIDYLSKNKIDYSFLRFFEKLPELHREGGDVDLLVADKDHIKVTKYLTENQGDIPVDVYSVSKPASENMVSYYPPLIARDMLSRSITDGCGAEILSDLDYALSFLYHIVYHKGGTSGLPTSVLLRQHYNRPDNDYLGHANNLLQRANLPTIATLEDAENILDRQGWKPKLDTLHFISRTNEWVKVKYFSQKFNDYGLGVFILKKGFFLRNTLKQFEADISQMGYDVLHSKICDENLGGIIYKELRGGNWHESGDTMENCYPAAVVVVSRNSKKTKVSMRSLKTKLRNKYDRSTNYIHGTDNSRFSEEYVDVIFQESMPRRISHIIQNNSKEQHAITQRDNYIIKIIYQKKSQLIDAVQSFIKRKIVYK